jgi:preprotein translocase subunit SecA
VWLIAGERHPLPEQDQRLIEFAQGLSSRAGVVFHLSLEDGLLKVVAPGVTQTLQQLGMKDDDRIESRLVSRQIAMAQRRLAGKSFGDSNAESAAEWLKENMPS